MIIESHLKPGGTFETLSYHDPDMGLFTVCYKYEDANHTEIHPDIEWDDVVKLTANMQNAWHDKFYVEGASAINVITVALTREINRNLIMFKQLMP